MVTLKFIDKYPSEVVHTIDREFHPFNIFFPGDVVENLDNGIKRHVTNTGWWLCTKAYFDDDKMYYSSENLKVNFTVYVDGGNSDGIEPFNLHLYKRPYLNWLKFFAVILFSWNPYKKPNY